MLEEFLEVVASIIAFSLGVLVLLVILISMVKIGDMDKNDEDDNA